MGDAGVDRQDPGRVVGADDGHRNRGCADVAVGVADRVGEAVRRRLTDRQVLPVGGVGRVDEAGAVDVSRRAGGIGQGDRAMGRLAMAEVADQVRHAVVGQDVDRGAGAVLGGDHRVVVQGHGLVGGVDQHAVDEDLDVFEPRGAQAEGGELEGDVLGLAVGQGVGLDEGQVAGEVRLEGRTQPFGPRHHQPQGVDVGAAVIDVARPDILGHDIDQGVVVGVAIDDVVARAAVEDVVTRAAVDAVVAGHAVNGVAARAAIEMFGRVGARDRIGT